VITIGSIPGFFLGIMLIILFASHLGWFPTSGMYSYGSTGGGSYLSIDFLRHFVLPFTTITLQYMFLPVMMMRTNIVETKDQDFFFYHRMTGISRPRRFSHLMKHASLPVITLYPISLARAIGGLVIIEIIFNWPGIGNALVSAIFARDVPVVQFIFFLIAAAVIIGNLIVDITYSLIDPRVSLGDSE
jgi:peptide/nickel transport system permease protein